MEKKPLATSENVQVNSSFECRLEAAVRDYDEEQPNKLTRYGGHRNTQHSRKNSGKVGSPKAKVMGLSQEHPVNIQTRIHAAERFSCSLDDTEYETERVR